MKSVQKKQTFPRAEFVYRTLLLAYPRSFRRWKGNDLLQLFRDDCREERQHDGRLRFGFLLAMFWDALKNGLLMRFAELQRTFKLRDALRNVPQDIRQAFRLFFKEPAFAAVIVLTLMLGIGANTAIFSIVDAVLLKPLSFTDSDRLMMIQSRDVKQGGTYYSSYPDFLDYRSQSRSFEEISIVRSGGYTMTGHGNAERIAGGRVSANFFSMLGVQPLLGRTYRPSEEMPGSDPVIMMSYSLWQRRFGGDPGIVGQSLTLNTRPHTVIGILPPDFHYPIEVTIAELWGTLALDGQVLQDRNTRNELSMYGRLARGVAPVQARTEFNGIAHRLEQQYPATNRNRGIEIVSLQEEVVGDVRSALLVLLAAVGFVLLIACSNVANLLLAHAASRRKEIAIRTALGAARWRILQQLATENILLALIGGVLAVLLARWCINAVISLNAGSTIPRLEEVGVDGRVLLFTCCISVLTGAALSLAPAWQMSRSDINRVLKEGSDSPRRFLLRQLFVVSEVAIAIVLLVGAGLLVRSFSQLLRVDLGFDPAGVLKLSVSLPATKYRDDQQKSTFLRHAIERIESVPGVQSVGVTNITPLTGYYSDVDFTIQGRAVSASERQPNAEYRTVTPGYFEAMRMRVERGRLYNEPEFSESNVVVINERMAHLYWPHEDPLGKSIALSKPDRRWREIIGIVADMKHSGVDVEAKPEVYIPTFSNPGGVYDILVRATLPPATLTNALREEFHELDPDMPLFTVRTMEDRVAKALARQRFAMLLLTGFASLALILAAIGIYGVMVHVAAERTREIGLRVALGARSADLLKMVVGEAMKMVLAGAAVGLALAFVIVRAMSGLLFGVSARDPLTFAAVSAVLGIVALAASYLPARRAAMADPMKALRG